jgi:hypothetical protein
MLLPLALLVFAAEHAALGGWGATPDLLVVLLQIATTGRRPGLQLALSAALIGALRDFSNVSSIPAGYQLGYLAMILAIDNQGALRLPGKLGVALRAFGSVLLIEGVRAAMALFSGAGAEIALQLVLLSAIYTAIAAVVLVPGTR